MSGATYDAIVVGLGGMGSATAYELARRGQRVLGLEQFDLVHDRGSSHGHTRIIRTAYYEHPSYVPLVRCSFNRWRELEQHTGARLLTDSACLTIGKNDSELVQGVRQSAQGHSLAIENLTASDLRRRFPQFRFSDECEGVIEQEAGILFVEECVRGHLQAAAALGAEIHANEPVTRWQATSKAVEVTTTKGHYSAARLILTAGPWAGQLLHEWGKR